MVGIREAFVKIQISILALVLMTLFQSSNACGQRLDKQLFQKEVISLIKERNFNVVLDDVKKRFQQPDDLVEYAPKKRSQGELFLIASYYINAKNTDDGKFLFRFDKASRLIEFSYVRIGDGANHENDNYEKIWTAGSKGPSSN